MGPGVPYAIGAKFAHPGPAGDRAGRRRRDADERHRRAGHDRQVLASAGATRALIVLVLHNNDLNQVTWEQRAMEGDPKLRRLPGAARLPVRPLRRADRPARASASTTPTTSAPPGSRRSPPTGRWCSRRSPTPTCRRCRRTSRSSRPRRSPRRWRTATPSAAQLVKQCRQAQARRVPARPDERSPPRVDAPVERLDVAAYTIPTDAPEADGTFELGRDDDRRRARRRGRRVGLGYTYADLADRRG